jgi:hypothetical protein
LKNLWFKKVGWTPLPVSWQGYLITAALLAFCIHIFFYIDSNSHSASDTLYGIFPFIVPAFLVYLWIGYEKMDK